MTEKDRELTEKMLDKAISQQSELIKLQFENVFNKLDSIHEEVKKTNGTVRDHTKLIQELKESEIKHVVNCPQKKEIDEINKKVGNIEKIEVTRDAIKKFTWRQVTWIGAVAGIVLTVLTIISNLVGVI